jgi:hypothetical protein
MGMADVGPLYRRVLGDWFAELHPTLRRFHSSAEGGAGRGRFRVTRSARWPGRLLASLLRLLPAQESVEVRLKVSPRGAGERWERVFGDSSLVTFQSARVGLLIEEAGPLHFGFAVEVVQGGMRFRARRVWLFGLPLPGWCSPSVDAVVVPNERGWAVTVRLTLPLLGPLLGYEGEVVPQWTQR